MNLGLREACWRDPPRGEMGVSYRLIRVGRSMNGMLGLDELFAELHAAGRAPDESLGPELVRRAREENYVPPPAEAEFAEALLREYRAYVQARSGSGEEPSSRPRIWHGFPREQIAWFPEIARERCDNCAKCIEHCPEAVFAWEGELVIVASPYDCRVGCNSCERVCPHQAIALPPPAILRGLLATG